MPEYPVTSLQVQRLGENGEPQEGAEWDDIPITSGSITLAPTADQRRAYDGPAAWVVLPIGDGRTNDTPAIRASGLRFVYVTPTDTELQNEVHRWVDGQMRDYVAEQGYVSGDAMVVKHEGLPGLSTKCWMDTYLCIIDDHEDACTDCLHGRYITCNADQVEDSDLGLCRAHLDQLSEG